jgi:hypothetical protein
MTSPEPTTGPALPPPLSSAEDDRTDARLRTELLHRHFVARVAATRRRIEELEELERTTADPDELAVSVGATVVEARRRLSAERAEADLRSEAFERAARRRGAEIVAEAEAEARVLRAAASWVRQASLAGPEAAPVTAPAADPVRVATPQPVLAAVEARAS